MTTIGDRIKAIRGAVGADGKKMSQAEFAKRLGIGQTAVGNYEAGANNPSSAIINIICREFHVNETWLRTGEGEMFIPMSRTDEIYAFIGKNLDGSDNFKHRLMWALSRLDEDGWKVLEKLVADMSEGEK